MLSHPNIHILLQADYRDVADQVVFDRMIFTGAMDEYFGYRHGPLPYRSVRFELRREPVRQFQSVAVVNFPNEYEFTRIIEYKQFSGQTLPMTTVAYEYPEAHAPGVNTPYYPIPREDTKLLYSLYLREAENLNGRIIFAGRLADYRYYNMDQAVGRALKVFDSKILDSKSAGEPVSQ